MQRIYISIITDKGGSSHQTRSKQRIDKTQGMHTNTK